MVYVKVSFKPHLARSLLNQNLAPRYSGEPFDDLFLVEDDYLNRSRDYSEFLKVI